MEHKCEIDPPMLRTKRVGHFTQKQVVRRRGKSLRLMMSRTTSGLISVSVDLEDIE